MNTVCTIITPDYLGFAFALHDSLQVASESDVEMFVLIAVEDVEIDNLPKRESLHYVAMDEVCSSGLGLKLRSKYFNTNISAFRWSMKPVLLKHILVNLGRDKALFLDGDLFFYQDPQFLFDALDYNRFLVTPHWRSTDPHKDPRNFGELFNQGIYNAGFVGVNQHSIEILDWWATACEYKCEISHAEGHHADQTYLNLVPVYFEGVEIIRNKGCNVANWNKIECPRTVVEGGRVLIAGVYPVVFIHFTGSTMRGIMYGKDGLLRPMLDTYFASLEKNGIKDMKARLVKKNKKSKKGPAFAEAMIKRLRKWLNE